MDSSPRRLGLTLSVLFFLMYFPAGAIFLAVFTFLARPLGVGGLGLTPGQVSAVAVAGALGNLAAIGLVHRLRSLTCRRALAILLTCAAILIGLLAAFAGGYAAIAASLTTRAEISIGAPVGVVAVIGVLLGCFTAVNSAASASAATFIQQCISGTGLSFYRLRSAGTLGWVCGGASLVTVTPVSIQPFWVGCGAFFVAAAYVLLALSFPRECPVAKRVPYIFPARSQARRSLPAKELAFVLILVGGTAVLGRLYDTYGNQFLTEAKFPSPCAMQPLLAQFPEFLLLLLVPFSALPTRYCFVLGPLAWVCVYMGFACYGRFDNSWAIFCAFRCRPGIASCKQPPVSPSIRCSKRAGSDVRSRRRYRLRRVPACCWEA